MFTFNTKDDDHSLKHYSIVTKLVRYTSKFTLNDDGRPPKHLPSTRSRLSSTLDSPDKPIESRRFRLASIWPEWNETEINNELWDSGIIKKKEPTTAKSRADNKANVATIPHHFEDPDGKIELPSSFKIEQWKRPVDFLSPDKPPVVVDADLGLHYFDLITSNEHLHHNEIMRDIISQITALWDIFRRESKTQPAVSERTWRPWEHIYALNKVSKHAFITPYNPMGKYVVRLFFLGAWRKIIIDDSIPFDSQNRCLLPQTTLAHELWPMLLTKALLKIISLGSLDDLIEYSETSVIHSLTGWIPEPIPLKYTYAEKVWNFLRYDRSSSSLGPVPLYKWSDSKPNSTTKKASLSGQTLIEQSKDPMTNTLEEKNSKKLTTTLQPPFSRESTGIRSANIKENRTITANNSPLPVKEVKRASGPTRAGTADDLGFVFDDQGTTDASKMIIFATMSHLHPSRFSSYGEAADRSERLRRYNLNDTFSTSIILTSIRDIPLKPPASASSPIPSEPVPAWKLIRPRKPKVLPHAEPIIPQETKSERWIEIASPYINYPTASALNIKPTIRSHLSDHNDPTIIVSNRRLHHPRKHSAMSDPMNIMEVEEDEDLAKKKLENPSDDELLRGITSISLPTTKKELIVVDIQDKSDTSTRSAGSKSKRESFVEKTKISRKSIVSSTKLPSDNLSIKSKGPENEPLAPSMDVPIIVDTLEEEHTLKNPERLSKIWMTFDDFCSCFTSIIVFHNPRGYQYNHKHTEIKFTPYQPPILTPVTREKKREVAQPVIQPIPNLQDDKSSIYLFVESPRDTLEKNIELIIGLTSLPRWYDAVLIETPSRSAAEKLSPDLNSTKIIVSQKEILPQTGSLTVESYSWKSLALGQPILRLQTSATKAALLTLPPGRHVLKLTNTCAFAFNLQILSDTNDFMLVDEDQLLNKLITNPEDAEFLFRAEELFLALEHSIQNFHVCPQDQNKLHELFQIYCQHAPPSINLTVQTCFDAFNPALYATIRTMATNTSGSVITAENQFAWKCFTNDLSSGDILGAYELKRTSSNVVVVAPRPPPRTEGRSSSSTGRRSAHRSSSDKNRHGTLPHSISISDVQEEGVSDWFTRELSSKEIDAIISIQKSSRNFLQRRMSNARKCGTDKNLTIQRALKSTFAMLKTDSQKSALLLFKNFISFKPQLIQCFAFRHDDWNMVHFHDYHGFYQEQPVNTWFILFREIFYFTEENFLAVKFLSHLPNSLLRVINNDTCEELPLVFNRLAPGIFSKNKNGYTFLAEGISMDQPVSIGRFRLRLITSYGKLPEPCTDPIASSFLTKEITDYYLPNKETTICRYRVLVGDDATQTGRKFHLASIHFTTSKPDVFMRLSLFDYDYEIGSVEGKGSVVLPAVLFMRSATNLPVPQPPPTPSKPPSKTTGSQKKSSSGTQRGSIGDLSASCKERITSGKRSRSTSRVGLLINDADDRPHKYTIQVTVLCKSWPLTATQWQFVEQIKQQQKYDLKVSAAPLSPTIKTERRNSNTSISKRPGSTSPNASTTTTTSKGRSKTITTPSGRIHPGKSDAEKSTIDLTKAYYVLRIVSDADKADELTFKKDNERNEELMNMKKAWETFQPGRAEKAMQSRQKFLDSLQIQPINDTPITPSDVCTPIETANTNEPPPPPPPVVKSTSSRKKSPFSIKKGSIREEIPKPTELILPQTPINEPLLQESPFPKPKLLLPPLDLQSFTKRKFSLNEFNYISEDEDLEHRRDAFAEYLKYLEVLHQSREIDLNTRSQEKIRQLEEYVDLQSRIDQIRRLMNEPREIFRQRYLEIERQRLQILAAEQQRLLDEAKVATPVISKGKNSAGKKKRRKKK